MMSFLKRIFHKYEYARAISSSERYITYLRKQGITLGTNCWFQAPETITVDNSRPFLVEIGNNCRFLRNFTLLTHDGTAKVFGPIWHEFLPSSGRVKIGNNVYFARNCTVLKGVTIGDNCVIGYGSIVVRNIPANSVAVGAPARVVCTIQEYYEKRKKQSLEEAFAMARLIYNKTGKRPTVEQMYEEFPFWMDGDQEDDRLRYSVRYQTRGYYDIYRKEHKAPFDSFNSFIEAALREERTGSNE